MFDLPRPCHRRNHGDIRNGMLTNKLGRSYVYAIVSPVAAILSGDKPEYNDSG